MNFGAIVKDYTSRHPERARRELRYYIIQRSLQDAIREAALSRLPGGKRHSHQRRIPLHVLQAAERRLQAIAGQVQTAKSFAELHRLIERHIKPIRGIGDLAVYDIAHRIGMYLQHAPEAVYLHAGTREGARRRGCGNCRRRKSRIASAFIRTRCAVGICALVRARCANVARPFPEG